MKKVQKSSFAHVGTPSRKQKWLTLKRVKTAANLRKRFRGLMSSDGIIVQNVGTWGISDCLEYFLVTLDESLTHYMYV